MHEFASGSGPRLHPTTVAGAVSLAVLAVAFGGLSLRVEWFWVAFPVGYGGVLPLAIGWARGRERAQERADEREQARDRERARERGRERASGAANERALIESLQAQYVGGEVDEATFERCVERVLAAEERQ